MTETKPPGKRGRPKKVVETEAVKTPGKRGRPKASANTETALQPVAAKKGRKKSNVDIGIDTEFSNSKLDFNGIFGKAIEGVAKKNDKKVTDFDGIKRSALVGIPFGNFALEVCFSESVLGLGRIICIDGMPGSCKSSIMWELARLMDKAGGASCIIDTEHKATENLGQGIVGYENFEKIKFVSPENFEEALQIITGMVKIIEANAKTQGKKIPLLMGLDSVTGSVSQAETDGIDKTGSASRGFDGVARLSAKYLKYLSSSISNLPITLVGVRHEKMVDTGYAKVPEPKGTGEWGFHAYNTFHLAKVGDKDMADLGGRDLAVNLKKGTDPGMKVPVTMWWKEEILEHGESLRHIWFDWEKSAFCILTDTGGGKIPLRFKNAIKDVLGPMNASAGKVVCKPLGLSTAATPKELHAALYHPDNIKVLDMLRAIFSIRVGQEFRYGDNFDDMKDKQRALILARRSKMKGQTEETENVTETENTEEFEE